MIEQKEIGLKVAENPTETLWTRVRDARLSTIKTLEESLIIEKAFLQLAEDKLKEFPKIEI